MGFTSVDTVLIEETGLIVRHQRVNPQSDTRFWGSPTDFDVYHGFGYMWHKEEYMYMDTISNI